MTLSLGIGLCCDEILLRESPAVFHSRSVCGRPDLCRVWSRKIGTLNNSQESVVCLIATIVTNCYCRVQLEFSCSFTLHLLFDNFGKQFSTNRMSKSGAVGAEV